MEPVQKLGKEALVSGVQEADGVDGADVRAKVVRGILHRVNLSRCRSCTWDASHGREKQGVGAAVMQQRTTCLEDHLLACLARSYG